MQWQTLMHRNNNSEIINEFFLLWNEYMNFTVKSTCIHDLLINPAWYGTATMHVFFFFGKEPCIYVCELRALSLVINHHNENAIIIHLALAQYILHVEICCCQKTILHIYYMLNWHCTLHRRYSRACKRVPLRWL